MPQTAQQMSPWQSCTCPALQAGAGTLLMFAVMALLGTCKCKLAFLLQGYKALLSSPWYLNLGELASEDWATYYQVEPLGFDGTREQHQRVMGGEVCPVCLGSAATDSSDVACRRGWAVG